MSSVIVTGAAGFVGAAVIRSLLRRGHNVTAVVRPSTSTWRIDELRTDVRLERLDLTDEGGVRRLCASVAAERCIHLAWYARPADYLWSAENTRSLYETVTLVESALGAGCAHFVIAGSCAEYDLMTGAILTEATPPRPSTLYGAAKVAASLVAEKLVARGSAAVAWARLFYMFGAREDRTRLVPAVITACLRREPLAVTRGEQVRDFLYVDDLADALVELSDCGANGTFNVCSGVPVTLADVFSAVETITGSAGTLLLGGREYGPADPMFVCGSNQKLQEATSWRPIYDLDRGLAAAVEWWQQDELRRGC